MLARKQLWFSTLLILTIFLSGCGLVEGEEKKAAKRLDINEWPTPAPTVTPVTPTPFVKVTLPPEAVATTTVTEATPPPPTALPVESAGGEAIDLQALLGSQTSALTQRFPTTAVAFAKADGAVTRQGPGATYSSSGKLAPGDLVGVLGKNAGGDWLYVLGSSLNPGWVARDAMRVMGDLSETTILPPDPVAALLAEVANISPSASAGPVEVQTTTRIAPNLDDLEPVTTATVKSNGLNARQGPGAAYNRLGTLAQADQVNILALNRSHDWALISTETLEFGWVYLANLAVDGAVTDAPIALSASPEADIPTGQIASISNIIGPAAVIANSNQPATGSSQPIPAATASDTPTFGRLVPLTTAQPAKPEVELRWGPGDTYGLIDTLTADDTQLSILGRDAGQAWLLVQVQNSTEDLGWIAANDLNIAGSLNAAPEVITARVNSNEIDLRRGPGILEDKVGLLGLNSWVRVLGLNEGRSWALAQPIAAEGLGWIPLRFLTANSPLAEIPEAPDIPVAAPQDNTPTDPLAPPPIPPRAVSASQLVIQLASGDDIMIIKPDGSGLRRLTNGIDPALSPDGQTVAFTRWQGETGSLWLIDSDGSNERQALGFIKQAKGPEWSPDGAQIVLNFQQGGKLEPSTTCTDLTQRSPRQPPRNATNIRPAIDNNGDPELCWDLPADPHWDLKVIDLAGGSFRDLDGGTYAFRPAWDPSQSWRIVSDGGRGLLAVSLDSDYRQTLSDNVSDSSPVFSPDGRYIALTAGKPGGSSGFDIYRLNRDGSGRVRLTETPLWVPLQPDGNDQQWNNVAPAWSPDGAQIAFLTDRSGRWQIWLMNADGSNQRPMFNDEINDQLPITYNFVDERVISWR